MSNKDKDDSKSKDPENLDAERGRNLFETPSELRHVDDVAIDSGQAVETTVEHVGQEQTDTEDVGLEKLSLAATSSSHMADNTSDEAPAAGGNAVDAATAVAAEAAEEAATEVANEAVKEAAKEAGKEAAAEAADEGSAAQSSAPPSGPGPGPAEGNNPLPDGVLESTMEIPPERVGAIIGTRGSVIIDMQQRTGAKMVVLQDFPHGTSRQLLITGTPGQIKAATEVRPLGRSLFLPYIFIV